ncbi:MAG: hypothetical protein ACXAC6_09320 [Candidatus Hodarchaeales archaeon]|jgi:hypothetical protein
MASLNNFPSFNSDPPSFPSLCELLTVSNDKQLYTTINAFISKHTNTYDRFIFLFPRSSSSLTTSFFDGELISASRLAENASILPLLYPRLLSHREEQDLFFRFFSFYEQKF